MTYTRRTISDAAIVRQMLLVYGAAPMTTREMRLLLLSRWPTGEWDFRRGGGHKTALQSAIWGLRKRGDVLHVDAEQGRYYALSEQGRATAIEEARDIHRLAREMWSEEDYRAVVGSAPIGSGRASG